MFSRARMCGVIHARSDNMIQSLAKYHHFLMAMHQNVYRNKKATIAGTYYKREIGFPILCTALILVEILSAFIKLHLSQLLSHVFPFLSPSLSLSFSLSLRLTWTHSFEIYTTYHVHTIILYSKWPLIHSDVTVRT